MHTFDASAFLKQTRKTVSSEWLRVGRNTSCEVHLPDPRVPLEQGMIVYRDGLVYMEGEGGRSRSFSHACAGPIFMGGGTLRIQPPSPEGAIDAAMRAAIS